MAKEATFNAIVGLFPARLTPRELVVFLAEGPDGLGKAELKSAIRELNRSGLIRRAGRVLEPTFAALCASDLVGEAKPGEADK